MSSRTLTTLRASVFLAAVWCVAGATPLLAQQISDSARVAPAGAVPATSDPSTPAPGPRLAPPFERVAPSLAPSHTSAFAPLAPAGGSHTIVISTLGLVLILVIVILLLK